MLAPGSRCTGAVRAVLATVAAASIVLLSACSSSGSVKPAEVQRSSTAAAGSDVSSGADTAAADKILADFVGHPSAFPASEPLRKRLSADSQVAFLQCPTSYCVLLASQLRLAAAALKVKFYVVAAGSSVSDLQNAMATILAKKPAGVVLAGIDPAQISSQLKDVSAAGIAIATIGITGTQQYGIKAAVDGDNSLDLQADIEAAWAVKQHGGATNVAFYNIPELSFSGFELAEFKKKMAALCGACSVRTVNVPVATLSTSAASAVVSDLQSHPKTNAAVFPTPSISGLASALGTAGLHPATFVSSPDSAALESIKDGGLTAGLGSDIGTMTWMTLDGLAREIVGQDLPTGPLALVEPMQLLQKQDITFDPSKGFLPYPDYAAKFKALWGTQ